MMTDAAAQLQQQAFSVVAAVTGQANVIPLSVPLVRFAGDYNTAALLTQILYWSDRTADPDGWFYKTYEAWEAELALSRYQVTRCCKKLKEWGLVETKVKKQNGVPVLHYRLDGPAFVSAFSRHLDAERPGNKGDSGSGSSLTNHVQTVRRSDPVAPCRSDREETHTSNNYRTYNKTYNNDVNAHVPARKAGAEPPAMDPGLAARPGGAPAEEISSSPAGLAENQPSPSFFFRDAEPSSPGAGNPDSSLDALPGDTHCSDVPPAAVPDATPDVPPAVSTETPGSCDPASTSTQTSTGTSTGTSMSRICVPWLSANANSRETSQSHGREHGRGPGQGTEVGQGTEAGNGTGAGQPVPVSPAAAPGAGSAPDKNNTTAAAVFKNRCCARQETENGGGGDVASLVNMLPEKLRQYAVVNLIKASVANNGSDYTKTAVQYTLAKSRQETWQKFKAFLGKTIDNGWSVGYVPEPAGAAGDAAGLSRAEREAARLKAEVAAQEAEARRMAEKQEQLRRENQLLKGLERNKPEQYQALVEASARELGIDLARPKPGAKGLIRFRMVKKLTADTAKGRV